MSDDQTPMIKSHMKTSARIYFRQRSVTQRTIEMLIREERCHEAARVHRIVTRTHQHSVCTWRQFQRGRHGRGKGLEGIMQLSKGTLDSLLNGLRKYDFAVFILAGDDITQIRDRPMASTRDNVIFELGLFIGHLGADRTFFVTPRSVSDLRIPTDLLGITYATYDDAPQDGNLRAALGPVYREIQQRIEEFPQTPLSGETRLYTIVGLLNKPPAENDDPCFQSFRYDYMHNQNPLANLWSDPRPGNCVTANICKGSQPSQFLRVNFRSSLAMRVRSEYIPRAGEPEEYRRTTITLGLLPDSPQFAKQGTLARRQLLCVL